VTKLIPKTLKALTFNYTEKAWVFQKIPKKWYSKTV